MISVGVLSLLPLAAFASGQAGLTAADNAESISRATRRLHQAPAPEDGPEDAPAGVDGAQSLSDVLAARDDLSVLMGLLESSETLAPMIQDPEAQLTLCAPNNDAFSQLDQDSFAALNNDDELLKQFLDVHVVPGATFAKDVTDGLMAPTLAGDDQQLLFKVSDSGVTVQAPNEGSIANVIDPDLAGGKSVAHVLDKVLIGGQSEFMLADAPGPADGPMDALGPMAVDGDMPVPADGVLPQPGVAEPPLGTTGTADGPAATQDDATAGGESATGQTGAGVSPWQTASACVGAAMLVVTLI